MTHSFNPTSDQNALGVYQLVGSQFSAIAPADHPEREREVRRIIRTLGSGYRPLWVTNIWRSPNGGLVRRCHHILGHYEPNPKRARNLITGLILPTTKLYGLEWRNPIFVDDLLDGLTNDERELIGRPSVRPNVRGKRRVLPRYEPLDSRIISGLRRGRWEIDNVSTEDQTQALVKAQETAA